MPADQSSLHGLYVLYIIGAYQDDDQSYQWSCSPLDTANGHYYLPDIPIESDEEVANMEEYLRRSESNTAYIFPITTAVNCSGTVSAIRFCYAVHCLHFAFNQMQQIFKLAFLEVGEGPSFTITDALDVTSTPTHDICTKRIYYSYNSVFPVLL